MCTRSRTLPDVLQVPLPRHMYFCETSEAVDRGRAYATDNHLLEVPLTRWSLGQCQVSKHDERIKACRSVVVYGTSVPAGGCGLAFRSHCRAQTTPGCGPGELTWKMELDLGQEVAPVPVAWQSFTRQRRVDWTEAHCERLAGLWLEQLPAAAKERILSDLWDGRGDIVDVRETASRSRADLERNALWIFPCVQCPVLNLSQIQHVTVARAH